MRPVPAGSTNSDLPVKVPSCFTGKALSCSDGVIDTRAPEVEQQLAIMAKLAV